MERPSKRGCDGGTGEWAPAGDVLGAGFNEEDAIDIGESPIGELHAETEVATGEGGKGLFWDALIPPRAVAFTVGPTFPG